LVVIGEEIEVEILEASPSQVKLGIRAPQCVPVVRKEIQTTRRENLAAAEEISPAALERIAECSRTLTPRR
jgi:carbon storage regulator CsrA